MAATDPATMFADEIRAQVAAALPALTYVDVETAARQARWPKEWCMVGFTGTRYMPEDNESVFASYSYAVVVGTTGEDRQEAANRLYARLRTIRLLLSDRASDRSPLATNPLPLTSLDVNTTGSMFQKVEIDAGQVGTDAQDDQFSHTVQLDVTVVCYETATG